MMRRAALLFACFTGLRVRTSVTSVSKSMTRPANDRKPSKPGMNRKQPKMKIGMKGRSKNAVGPVLPRNARN